MKPKSNKSWDYESLESRNLLTGVSIETIVGRATLVVDGTSQNDTAVVRDASDTQVSVLLNGDVSTFEKADFVRIRFLGRSGDDNFTNETDIDSAIIGHDGNDTLTGGNGHNWIRGGDGNDTLTGGDRNDLIRAGDGGDLVFGGRRHDRIFGEAGNDNLRGQHGNDFIDGDVGADVLYGYTGNDRLFGDFGNDEIFGGEGDDRGSGGTGDDTVNLGGGTDVAIFDLAYSEYSVGGEIGSLVVTGSVFQGADSVITVESLRFSDGSQPAEPTEVELNEGQEESLRLLNQLRSQQNLSQLTAAQDLNEFAQSWALEMSQNGFMHSTDADRAHLVTGGRLRTSENIVFAGDTSLTAEQAAAEFHETWENSSVHFANMTNASNIDVGIGLVLGSDGWYGVHVFGVG